MKNFLKKFAKLIAATTNIIIKILITQTSGNISYARYIGVKVGLGCRIYIKDFGSEPFLVSIGNRVTIAHGVKLITHDGSAWLIRDEKGRRYKYQGVSLGNDVFVGMNSIILPGVKVGNKVIIGAGSVVTKSVPDGKVVCGNPARIISNFDNYEKKSINFFTSDVDIDWKSPYRERIKKVTNLSFKYEMK